MHINTILHTLEHLYQKEDASFKIKQGYEDLKKYVSEKQVLTHLEFFQFINDFTNKTGVYVLPYTYKEEEFNDILRITRYPLLLHNDSFTKFYIFEPQEEKVIPKIWQFESSGKKLIDELPFNELKDSNNQYTAYIVSKTKSLFGFDNITTEKKIEKRDLIGIFFRMLKPDRKEIIYLYIYAIFGGFITLSLPLGIQSIIGLVMGAQYSSSLLLMIAIVIAAVLVAGVMQIMQIWIVESLQQKIFVRSAFEFAFKASKIKLDALVDKYAPELMNRFFDTVNIQKTLPKILIDFTQANLQILFGLILLSIYHPLFIIFGAFLLLIFYLIFRFTGPAALKASIKESKYKYEVAFWLEEMARTMRIFKVAGNTNLPLEKTDLYVSNYVDSRKKHFRILATQFGYMVLFKMLVTGSLLIMGSILIMEQQINLGQFVASEIIIILILNAIEKVILSLENIYDMLTSIDKLSSVTDLPIDRQDGIPFNYIDSGKGAEIEFNIQSVKSLKNNVDILHDIKLTIKPGEKVCITGPNGSGKSSLLSLATGLQDNYTGQILINGLSIDNINLRSIHDFTAQNFAREMIFKGSLYENITLGRKDIPMQDVMWAVELTGLDVILKKLPKGLETILGPEDRTIPDGDIAKIVMARCLAEKPRLLLLEEFLETFDLRHRKKIIDHILGLGDKTTVLAISGDPDFASKCDRVIIMDKGTVLFDGKFEDIRKEQYLKSMFYSIF